jgi:hypothetical protein
MMQHLTLFNPAFLASLGQGGVDYGPDIMPKITSHWTLDETTGNRLDSVGELDLTTFGVTGYTEGKQGNCLVLNSSGALQTPSDASMAPGSGGSVTYCLWVAVANTAGVPLSKNDTGALGAGADLFQIRWTGSAAWGSTPAYRFALEVAINSFSNVLLDYPNDSASPGWHFIALTLGAGGNKLSVDGGDWVSSGHTTVNDYANHDHIPLVVGGNYVTGTPSQPSPQFSGNVDEITLCDEALSIEEVRWLYNGGAGRAFPFA